MNDETRVTPVTALADLAETPAEPRPYSAVEDTQ